MDLVNGNIFGDAQLGKNGQQAAVPGIYSGISAFFKEHALANSDIILTWDNNAQRGDTRRSQVCGKAFCNAQQTQLRTLTGDKSIALSCDEFPFASSEEGGKFLSTRDRNPITAQKTCVPAWQNSLQGNCNSEFPFHSAFPQLVGLM